MADVRSLLRNERASRRITHPQATYSTTGRLICLVCQLQLKSESLWEGHLRSPQHVMRIQKKKEGPRADGEQGKDALHTPPNGAAEISSKKRKADGDEEQVRKRSKAGGLPEGFFDDGVAQDTTEEEEKVRRPSQIDFLEVRLPSRPATPLKSAPEATPAPKLPLVDEDEWAAFEADIAAAEIPVAEDAVISAPAISTAELAAKSREEESAQRKERLEAEMEGDKEDAARKLEEEFEEMEELESRMKKLKERREALRLKDASNNPALAPVVADPDPVKQETALGEDEDEDDSEDDDDDDWDGFRLKA